MFYVCIRAQKLHYSILRIIQECQKAEHFPRVCHKKITKPSMPTFTQVYKRNSVATLSLYRNNKLYTHLQGGSKTHNSISVFLLTEISKIGVNVSYTSQSGLFENVTSSIKQWLTFWATLYSC